MRINYVFGLAILTLSGCSLWNQTDDRKPSPLPNIANHSNSISIKWQQDVGKPISEEIGQTTIATIGLDIIVASKKTITRINSQSGQIVWQKDFKKIQTGVASNDKYIAFVDSKNNLVVLDTNGNMQWSSRLYGDIQASPFISENIVILKTKGNKLIAYNLDNQKLVWQNERIVQGLLLHTKRNAMVSPKKGMLLVGFHNAKVVAFENQTGMQKWEQTLSYSKGFTDSERINDVVSTPVVYGETACASSYQGKIGCFDINNGSLSWEKPFSAINNLINDNDAIYATDNEGAVTAFDYNGNIKWQQKSLINRSLSDGVVMGNTLVYNDFKGFLHIIDKNTGIFVGRTKIQDNSVPMIKVGNTIIMQSNNGKLYGLNIK